MKNINNLYRVKATLLPARVLVLLSKYSKAIKEDEGIVVQLSSINVFKHVHNSYIRSNSPAVKNCYRYLLREVNIQLAQGNMVASPALELSSKKSKTSSYNGRPVVLAS